jgi:hypothetical protein
MLSSRHRKSLAATPAFSEKRKVNGKRNPQDIKRAGDEKDWFHLLLEIEHRFRVEERKNLRLQWEITQKLIKKPSADG